MILSIKPQPNKNKSKKRYIPDFNRSFVCMAGFLTNLEIEKPLWQTPKSICLKYYDYTWSSLERNLTRTPIQLHELSRFRLACSTRSWKDYFEVSGLFKSNRVRCIFAANGSRLIAASISSGRPVFPGKRVSRIIN